ncbi:hypothetical protein FOL46_000154 [Perkinsus olseni]|uniref:Uncharacterized protein n=1 Tax=Perkinsus olseni TaxID=32597 RepID=A0A7J6MJ31_PEROL|nr:hypothetical protein FOL46_000154 [Perkinsus olseni]
MSSSTELAPPDPEIWSRARQFLTRLESADAREQDDLLVPSAESLSSTLQAEGQGLSSLVKIIKLQKERIASLQASLEGRSSIDSRHQSGGDGALIHELRTELSKAREEVVSLHEHIRQAREMKETEERLGLHIVRAMMDEVGGESSREITDSEDCLFTARLFTRQRSLLVSALRVADELREDNVKLSLQLSNIRGRLERLGGEAAVKGLSAAVQARDRQIAEKDAKIADLSARLEAIGKQAAEEGSNTSLESSMISERTNLEASDKTGLSVVAGPHDGGHIRDHDVDGNKEQPGTREVIERCSAVTESEDSQSPVHAPTAETARGQDRHVRGEAIVPPPAPLLTGRDLDVTDVSMEVVEGATTVRNSTVMASEANRGLQRATPTSKAMPETAVVAVSTPGRVSNATKLSLSATTFNGVKRRATTNVKLRNPRLDLASVAASTDTKLPASRHPAAPACDDGFAGVPSLPQSGDLLRAWHPNSGSFPGYDSPSVWSPQQPPMVQRHYSANATSTAGGRRKLIARQLSGTPILTADLPRRDTPDAHSLQAGMVRPPPALSSHIPRPPQFMNLGALSHRSTVASTTTTSRQSSAAQFVPLVGSPVTTEQASFLGISPGGGRVTPGSSGLRMVNNTPIPQLPLHKAANYTVGLPLWSAASSGQRGNGLPVLGQGVMRSAR